VEFIELLLEIDQRNAINRTQHEFRRAMDKIPHNILIGILEVAE